MIFTIFNIINLIFTVYLWSLLALVISSWLISFNIINPYQPLVRLILSTLHRVHDPILRPIRILQYRLLPNAGGLDLSPIIALLLAQYLVLPIFHQLVLAIFA